jgi:cellulose synthase/poly-beta-1,6-N-acetylglucosamine synthase-like glycosyltransferase
MTNILYILATLALIQGLVSLRGGIRNMQYARSYRRGPSPSGSVVVFCPATGNDPDLAANAQSLLKQDHPDHKVVFIVESREDPAFGVLSPLEGSELLVAGPATESGQKVHNLAEAVGSYGAGAEIFVFCDADALFPSEWLSDLVAPLSDPSIGASTGYRWYEPGNASLPTLLRSAWNASVAGFLGPHRNNFAWGGSTAIRRETFDQAGVLEAWKGSVSDDYSLASAVRRVHLAIVYVPTCLVPSYGDCSWRELLEFTTRQIKITRVYAWRIWALGMVTYTLFNLTFLSLAIGMFFDSSWFLPWAAIYILAMVRSRLRLDAAGRTISSKSPRSHAWFHLLSPPLVAFLYQINFVASMLSRRIVWRGIGYLLISPSETRTSRR